MLYINGEWCKALGGETYPVHNPATGELIKETAKGGKEDAQIAIGAAKEALSAWSKLTAKDRYVYLKKAADLLRDRVDPLAKPLQQRWENLLQKAEEKCSLQQNTLIGMQRKENAYMATQFLPALQRRGFLY